MNNKGASLILAIFMLVVFAIIGIAIVSMLSTSSISSSEELISTQAFFMAESGAEIKIKQALDGNNSNAQYKFNNYTINVNLQQTSIMDNKTFYTLKSEANKGNIKRAIIIKFWK